ncbi:hypothetical protein KKE45_01025, partial [Patescibacteria group bacterium]|nr:hypothetical protein [Patescibacteria group bacterium]
MFTKISNKKHFFLLLSLFFIIISLILITQINKKTKHISQNQTKTTQGQILQASDNKTGYIQMDSSGKGFVYEGGAKFIPIGFNASPVLRRLWLDGPNNHEYLKNVGSAGYEENCQNSCNQGCLPAKRGPSFEEWFTDLEQSGINSLRVWIGSNYLADAPGMYPPPIDRYNVFDVPMCSSPDKVNNNPGGLHDKQIDGVDFLKNYPDCRFPDFTNQNCGPVYGPKLRDSYLTRMLSTAQEHGIKIKLTLFQMTDIDTRSDASGSIFGRSPYNNQNCWYNDDSKCGPIGNPVEFWTHGEWDKPLFSENSAIDHAKRYVAFLIRTWGNSKAVWNWEIWNEQEFASTDMKIGHEEDMVEWIKNMAAFIKKEDNHNRPVTVSSYRNPNKDYKIKMNKRFELNNIDFVQWHFYDWENTVPYGLNMLRNIEKQYNKTIQIGEFWPCPESSVLASEYNGPFVENTYKGIPPWSENPEEPYEQAPYRGTLGRLWLSLIATGTNVAHRWPGKIPGFSENNDVINLHILYRPLKNFLNQVSWNNWNFSTSIPWEEYLAGDIGFKVARGDGDQVFLMVQGLNNTSNININNLDN